MFWLSLDGLLTRIRPQREALSLLLDAAVIALAWQATYLFRLGFERWFSARPDYDNWVMVGLVLLYVIVLWLLRVPKGMFSVVLKSSQGNHKSRVSHYNNTS